MKNMTILIFFLLTPIFIIAQSSKFEFLIEKAALFVDSNYFKKGFLKGEVIPVQFIDDVYLIKVYNINVSHPMYTLVPITQTGTVIEKIEINEFNLMPFTNNSSYIDKSILYLLMNGISINKIITNNENFEYSELLKIIDDIKKEYKKHRYVIPILKKQKKKECSVRVTENKQKTKFIVFVCILTQSKESFSKIRTYKFFFKNRNLVKLKGSVYKLSVEK